MNPSIQPTGQTNPTPSPMQSMTTLHILLGLGGVAVGLGIGYLAFSPKRA